MSRIIRAALAGAASVAALASTVAPAQAAGEPSTPHSSTATAVKLQVESSGQCLTIAKGTLRNGGNVVQSKCADDLDYQIFDLVPVDSASFELRPRHSAKCVEVDNAGSQPGTNVQQWWCGDVPQQRWRLNLMDLVKETYELRPMHNTDRCLDITNASMEDGANAQLWYCNSSSPQRWKLLPVKD